MNIFIKKIIVLGVIICFGCAKQNHKIIGRFDNSAFSKQELCYINNKMINYIIENNEMEFDAQFFSALKFDKSKSFILYQKMNDSLFLENLHYAIDSSYNASIKYFKNSIEVLSDCNSTQMPAHYIEKNIKSSKFNLNTTSKYKCQFSISDVAQVGEKYYVFCEYSEYFDRIDEIEVSRLGFQFRKCKNNDFIKFENFLEWHSEMFGQQHVKLINIENDSIVFNDIPKNDRFHIKAGFYVAKIKGFQCDE